jgi:thiol-disulfide isomerase/thioredoxin
LLSTVWPQYEYTGLFFYSSTCDHCHAQMPGLVQLVKDLKPRQFHLIGIALDITEEEFRTTLDEEHINWPCYTELKAWGAQGAKDYNVKATPTIFVIDRQGKIRAKPLDHQELRYFLVENRN